jgi:hypothetical protein
LTLANAVRRLGDINADGFVDMIIQSSQDFLYGEQIMYLRNAGSRDRGNLRFLPPDPDLLSQLRAGGSQVFLFDIDHDGDLDLGTVSTIPGEVLRFYENTGTPTTPRFGRRRLKLRSPPSLHLKAPGALGVSRGGGDGTVDHVWVWPSDGQSHEGRAKVLWALQVTPQPAMPVVPGSQTEESGGTFTQLDGADNPIFPHNLTDLLGGRPRVVFADVDGDGRVDIFGGNQTSFLAGVGTRAFPRFEARALASSPEAELLVGEPRLGMR